MKKNKKRDLLGGKVVDEGIGSTRSESMKKGEEGSDDRPAHIAGREVVTAAVSSDKTPSVKVSENPKDKNVSSGESSDQAQPNIHLFGFGSDSAVSEKEVAGRDSFIMLCLFYQLPFLSTFVISLYFSFFSFGFFLKKIIFFPFFSWFVVIWFLLFYYLFLNEG